MLYTSLLLAAVAGSTIAGPITLELVLEDYDTYHLRYIALDCQTQQNTPFFTECCQPLNFGTTAADTLAPHCVPTPEALESAADRIANVAATAEAEDDEDADDTYEAFCESQDGTFVDVPEVYQPPPTCNAGIHNSAPAPQVKPPREPEPEWQPEPEPETTNTNAEPPEWDNPPEAQTPPEEQDTPDTPQEPAPELQDDSAKWVDTSNWISGTASFYDQNDGTAYDGQPASCGQRYENHQHVVALPLSHGFDTMHQGYGCNGLVTIQYTNANGETKVATAPAVDACPSCGPDQIDLSTSLWQSLESNMDIGIIKVKWKVDV